MKPTAIILKIVNLCNIEFIKFFIFGGTDNPTTFNLHVVGMRKNCIL